MAVRTRTSFDRPRGN